MAGAVAGAEAGGGGRAHVFDHGFCRKLTKLQRRLPLLELHHFRVAEPVVPGGEDGRGVRVEACLLAQRRGCQAAEDAEDDEDRRDNKGDKGEGNVARSHAVLRDVSKHDGGVGVAALEEERTLNVPAVGPR